MILEKPQIIYENTVRGHLVRRVNRFAAEVEAEGGIQTVHVKNTGRLQELLVPGAEVTLQWMDNPGRRTSYDLISVYKPGLEWVNIDSLAPNGLVKQELKSRDYDTVRPEFTYGESRFDFYMERGGSRFLTEVKGCTLASATHEGAGLFPDAPTQRGVKHLNELAAASGKGYICSICFVIQMNGIHRVEPNDKTQPEFRRALARAVQAGVQVVSYSCHVEADCIMITDAYEVGHK